MYKHYQCRQLISKGHLNGWNFGMPISRAFGWDPQDPFFRSHSLMPKTKEVKYTKNPDFRLGPVTVYKPIDITYIYIITLAFLMKEAEEKGERRKEGNRPALSSPELLSPGEL